VLSKQKGEILMACFLVPAAEAVVTSVASKAIKTKAASEEKISFAKKLGWLSKLMWGGCALLCYEHIWHGEVVPWFPFLTAMNDPEETVVMLGEMASVGGTMAIWLTAIWVVMCLVADKIVKRAPSAEVQLG
jgi:hypothetical protein